MAQTTIQGTFLGDGTVTGAKIGADFISAQTELDSGLATTDEIIVSDAGVIKRMDISVLEIAATQITASGTLPALNGSNLTALNGTQITSGTVPAAQLGSNHDNARFLRGDNTWQAVSGGSITDLNGEAENRIPTFGSTTTELDGSANLTFNGATLVVTHTSSGNAIEVKSTGTNSNAQARITNDVRSWDFSVRGDASDSLFITDVGAGDLSGLENRIKIATGGEVTMPAQPAFQTKQDSGDNNVTGDGSAWTFGHNDAVTDRFDIGSNVSSTAVFTAPVTGTYVLSAHITVVNSGIDSSHDNYMVTILTSNRSYDTFAGLYAMRAATGNIGATMVKDTVIADMDAGDTAVMKFYVYDGSKTVDINSGNNTYFAGYLVG